MILDAAQQIARAVLYEGYLLYPYYGSSIKNQQRWTFGSLFPPSYIAAIDDSEPGSFECECLIEGNAETVVEASIRFLHLRSASEASERLVEVPGRRIMDLARLGWMENFEFEEAGYERVRGRVEILAFELRPGLYRLRIQVSNVSEGQPVTRADALLRSLVSAHALLSAERGAFVSAIDPPEDLLGLSKACVNRGVFPVLVGQPGERNHMLCSPIILYDHPKIAPESPGDLFDATEIDEILSLRILTLTPEEKEKIRQGDERGRRLLERTESLTEEQMMRLHGALRDIRAVPVFKPGERVRLRPLQSRDILDLALAGMTATIEAIEQDLDGGTYLSVTLDDDPGKDLGKLGQPGHRFFFKPEEVERL